MLTRSPRYAHADPILVNKYILMLSGILEFEICKFIHRDFYKNKIFNLAPGPLAHSYNIRFNTDISFSHVRTNFALIFVLHKGVKMYKFLPNVLKNINDFQKFKRAVNSYLLNT